MPSTKEVCYPFQRGNCRYGERCRYSHERQKYTKVRTGKGSLDMNIPICLDYKKWTCSRGERCNFRHEGPSAILLKKRKIETSSSSEHESDIEKFIDSDGDPDDSSTSSSSAVEEVVKEMPVLVENVEKERSTESSGNFFTALGRGDNTSVFDTDSDYTYDKKMKKTKTEYNISEDFDSTDEEDLKAGKESKKAGSHGAGTC